MCSLLRSNTMLLTAAVCLLSHRTLSVGVRGGQGWARGPGGRRTLPLAWPPFPFVSLIGRITESLKLKKTSKSLRPTFDQTQTCQPNQSTECHLQSFLGMVTQPPPWEEPSKAWQTFQWTNSSWFPTWISPGAAQGHPVTGDLGEEADPNLVQPPVRELEWAMRSPMFTERVKYWRQICLNIWDNLTQKVLPGVSSVVSSIKKRQPEGRDILIKVFNENWRRGKVTTEHLSLPHCNPLSSHKKEGNKISVLPRGWR